LTVMGFNTALRFNQFISHSVSFLEMALQTYNKLVHTVPTIARECGRFTGIVTINYQLHGKEKGG